MSIPTNTIFCKYCGSDDVYYVRDSSDWWIVYCSDCGNELGGFDPEEYIDFEAVARDLYDETITVD